MPFVVNSIPPVVYSYRQPNMRISEDRPVIGRREIADLPELNISGLPVKIDTGAYNSSFHCEHFKRLENGNLEVVFLDPNHPFFTGEVHEFRDYKQKSVKSSNGQSERRYVISSTIRFAGKDFPIDFSLADRGDMRFTVLIGRKFLRQHKFIVDPMHKDILSRPGRGKAKRR